MPPNIRQGIRRALVARLRKTVQIWIAVYPAVLIVLTFVGELLRDWPLPVRVLGATMIIVPIVANITEPAVKTAVAAIERGLARRGRLPEE